MLVDCVLKYKAYSWNLVAMHMMAAGKTKQQCMNRWHNVLRLQFGLHV